MFHHDCLMQDARSPFSYLIPQPRALKTVAHITIYALHGSFVNTLGIVIINNVKAESSSLL